MIRVKYGVCKFEKSGTVHFSQHGKLTRISCNIKNKKLKDGLHGMHVHKHGDITQGCTSTCDHYNPTNEDHGGATGTPRHRGDLGNILVLNGTCTDVFYADVNVWEIIGRALVIHADKDDLGTNPTKVSKKTGNAGKRIDCGVIGICKNPQKYNDTLQ